MELRNSTYKIEGYELLHEFYTCEDIDKLTVALNKKQVFTYQFADVDSHNLFKSIDEVRQISESGKLLSIAQSILGSAASPCYAIMLDKTKHANWGLDWHQDLRIAVKDKIETEGYTDWSMEAGIWHVTPPCSILEQMLSIRIHLDDCSSINGALSVIPGSQQSGILKAHAVADRIGMGRIVDCETQSGGVMLMSPLLLHKSPYSTSAGSRRVLQIEYRSTDLDGDLKWYN